MSLVEFQRALADLVASPGLCAETIESPEAAMRAYDLTERELARLSAMVRDPLMAPNCMLYRANRMTPIFMFFPKTCHLLGQSLRSELDVFWATTHAVDLQYLQETARFANFIKERARLGVLNNHYLEEIVDYEKAATELRFASPTFDSLIRFVCFKHDPMRLLTLLENSEPVPSDLPCGNYCVAIQVTNERLEVTLLHDADEMRGHVA